MITIRIAQLEPDPFGRPTFVAMECPEAAVDRSMRNIRVNLLVALQATPEQIDRVIYAGVALHGEELSCVVVDQGDEFVEFIVLPAFEGKNAALILGIAGAIIGFYIGGVGGAQFAWGAAMQGAMVGYSLGSMVGTLLTPRPRVGKGSDETSTYLFNGIENEDRAGTTIPVVLGEHRTGGTRISSFIRRGVSGRRNMRSETMGVLLLVSRGEIEDIDEIWINDQPLSNFPGVTVHKRLGAAVQSQIPGFNAIVNTWAQNVNLTELGTWYTYTTNRIDCDAFEVLMTLPGLSHAANDGTIRENSTRYEIEYRLAGTADPWINIDAANGNGKTLTASTRSVLLETRRVEGLAPGKYEIRVRWVQLSSPETDPSRDQWHIYLTGVTEEKQDSRTYPGHALLGIIGIAGEQLHGRLPTVTCRVKGIKVPRWTGAGFTLAEWVGPDAGAPVGRNPAWLTLEVIRNPVWGSGEEFTDVEINVESFRVWAEKCSVRRTVQLEQGGEFEEPKCQLDIVLNAQTNWRDLVMLLAQAGRAVIVMSDGVVSAVVDEPAEAVQTFGMGNIDEASFGLQFQSKLNQINAYDVTINDRDRDFEPNSKLVVSKQQVEVLGQPMRQQQISRPGTTRMTQAIFDTRVELNVGMYVRRVATWKAFADAILAQAGDVVRLSHDVPQWGYSGRVSADSANHNYLVSANRVVFVDQPLYVDQTQAYEMTLTYMDDDVTEIIPVDTTQMPTGIHNVVFLAADAARVPKYGDRFSFGRTNISTKKFRILEITMDDSSRRKLTAIEVIDGVHDDSGVINLIPFTDLPNINALPGPISAVTVTNEISQRKDDSFVETFIIQWPIPDAGIHHGAYTGADIERSYNYNPADPSTASWEAWRSTDGNEERWVDVPHGMLIGFRVTPKSVRGSNFNGAAIGYRQSTGYSTAPGTVQNFRAAVKDNAFVWEWDEPGQEYQVELRNANSGWGDDDPNVLVTRTRAQKYILNVPSARSVTLYAKVIDMNHNASVGAVSATAADTAPVAPTINLIKRAKNTLVVKVTPNGATNDYQRILLHASQTPGFAPTSATIVGIASGRGGEIVHSVPTSGAWYYKATVEDWLSAIIADWAYSTEWTSSIILLQPVDPTAVTLTTEGDVVQGGIKNPDGSVRPINRRFPRVQWNFVDNVNPAGSVQGFEIFIWKSSETYLTPAYESGLIAEPGRTIHQIHNVDLLPGNEYVAGVRIAYVDGITSNLVTSAGQTIPQDTRPPLQNSDDRNVTVFAESFDGAGMPTGMSVTIGSVLSVGGSGAISILSAIGGLELTWDFNAWRAAYTDLPSSAFTNYPVAIVRMYIVPNGAVNKAFPPVFIHDATSFPIYEPMPDDGYHTYRVPLAGNSANFGTDSLKIFFPAGYFPPGSAVSITAIAIATESFDQSLDGYVDRAQRARDQFGRDTGGGFFMLSPHRIGDGLGNYTISEENGAFWVRNDGVVVGQARRATKARVTGGGGIVNWNDASRTQPTLPVPIATNKTRIIVSPLEQTMQQAPPGFYPRRVYYDATEIGPTGFDLLVTSVLGGNKYVYRDMAAGGWWNQTAASKSNMALSGSYAYNVNDAGNDAWYNTDGRIVLPNGGWFTPILVAYIDVFMPLQKKTNGSYYRCDLQFALYHGTSDGANPMALNFAYFWGVYHARVLTDGQTHRVVCTYGNSIAGSVAAGGTLPNNSIKADWIASTIETGGSGPSTVGLVGVEIHYIEYAVGSFATSGAGSSEFDVIMMEDF